MQSRNFFHYYFGAARRPEKTFENLLEEPRMLAFATRAVLIMAVLYTLVYIFLIAGGGRPFKPWLDIQPESYYQYNVFFCAPSMFLGWILASGVVQLTCGLFEGKGTFEQTLAVFGFGIGIASWSTGLHDLLTSFLGGMHIIDQRTYEMQLNTPTLWRALLWIQMLAYLIWFIFLFHTGIKTVHKVKRGIAFFAAVIGFLVYQLFFLIFNR